MTLQPNSNENKMYLMSKYTKEILVELVHELIGLLNRIDTTSKVNMDLKPELLNIS